MANKDLDTVLKREAVKDLEGPFWALAKSKIAYRVIVTLRELHSRGVMHRDLKPLNIFLDANYDPVIGDWGLARSVNSCSGSEGQGNPTYDLGTAPFMAPELQDFGAAYDASVDIFSYGVMIYAMFAQGQEVSNFLESAVKPKRPDHVIRLIRENIRYKRQSKIPNAWWTLICECWNGPPSFRPPADEICERIARDPASYAFPEANAQEFSAYIQNLERTFGQ
jgi:serine/threonine protein kinase